MKVTGKEKDYYDLALNYTNVEQTTWFRDFKITNLNDIPAKTKNVFLDFKKEVKFKFIKESFSNLDIFKSGFYYPNTTISNGVIVFAGKIYPFIKIHDNDKKSFTFYDKKTFVNFLKKHDSEHVLSSCNRNKYYYMFEDRFGFRNKTLGEKIEHIFEMDYSQINVTEFHLKVNSPIIIFDVSIQPSLYKKNDFVNQESNLISDFSGAIVSGCLRNYSFIKVFEPYLFVQELEMFMGNIFVKQDPIPVMTDKVKINSHGFDDVVSFRKRKD